MKMRAAVLYEQGKPAPYAKSRPLVIENVDLAAPGEGEMLVEIAAAGLCHSDLSSIAGVRPRPLPMVPGHEAAGVVREVGPGVTRFGAGDHIVMVFVSSCGHCGYCSGGRNNLCEASWKSRANGTLPSGLRKLRAEDVTLNHNSGLSVFAEYAVISQNSAIKIEKDVPLEDAAVFGCAVITGVGAVVNTAKAKVGSRIAVIGLGGVGLSAILGARVAGASRIIAIDINEHKLALAKELGATDVVDARDARTVELVKDLTQGGVDHAFEMAGAPAATQTAYSITRRGGQVVIAGLPGPSQTFAIPVAAMVSDERVVAGSYMGSSVPERDIPLLLELYRGGHLPVQKLRTGSVTLDTLNEGFDRLEAGQTVRDILLFDRR
jgi:alcohol dehydrogenase